MATVPKLNYTNLRNKSKSKECDASQRKTETPQNDLFSHMNQDNLKYIQNQIKQKNRKSNQSARQEEPSQLKSYPQLIEQKSSKYEETQRQIDLQSSQQNDFVAKTEGQNLKVHELQSLNRNRKSEDAETYKLSYYDLVSQAKSKRISSIEGYMDEDKIGAPKDQNFLQFLENYITDLNKERSKVNKPLGNKQNKKTEDGQRNVFMRVIGQQKRKNVILAKEIERFKSKQDSNTQRIEALEGVVALLSEQLQCIKRQFRSERDHYKHDYRNMAMTMDLRGDNSRISRNSQVPVRNPMQSRFLRKGKYHQNEQILQLERQLRMFQQTGQIS